MPQRKLSPEDVRRLYEQHGPALVAYACSFLPDLARAEDAVHTVFLRLLRGDVAEPQSPAGYLYRAVKNAALNLRRDASRESADEIEGKCFIHKGGDLEAALTLQRVLGELPDDQREVVVMRIWSGMTLEEVSAAVGVPLNTAASRYRYALEKLREKMTQHIQEAENTP